MNGYYGSQMVSLIEQLSRLPGIGSKTAGRLAFHIISMSKDRVEELAQAIVSAKDNIKYCKRCCTITDNEICPMCADKDRDQKTIMVVEDSRDMAAYEKTGEFRGIYHILQGVISPLAGIGPNEVRVKELLDRIKEEDIEEIILATNPNVEGETTAMYISKLVKPLGIKTTRIAHGVPVGGDLEYVDEVTLSRALQGRLEI